MTSKSTFAGMSAVAMLASGCATNTDTPLIFVQSNTAGISIGGSATDQGADFVLGYKGSDFAIVPVVAIQKDGNTAPIKAISGTGHSDALSVFGQFKANSGTDPKTPKIGLGKFFATGQAARRLADGFAVGMGDRAPANGSGGSGDCKDLYPQAQQAQQGNPAAGGTADAATAAAAARAADAANTAISAANSATASAATAVVANTNPSAIVKANADLPRPAAASMIFGEHTTFGFVLSGSAAEGGASVTVGFKDRDIAVVPTVRRLVDGTAISLYGQTDGHSDGLSVLGQFSADSRNGNDGKLDVGLGRYFVTGLAAKRLADGFAAKTCAEAKASAAK